MKHELIKAGMTRVRRTVPPGRTLPAPPVHWRRCSCGMVAESTISGLDAVYLLTVAGCKLPR